MALIKIVLGNKNLFINRSYPKFEFHISKEVRNKYNFDDGLFSINGNVILADFNAVRLFVQKINSKRKVKEHVASGQVNAAGLIDEIYHYLFRLYEFQINPGVFKKALNHLNSKFGEEKIRKVLLDFVSIFPPMEVYKGKSSALDYLNSYSADRSNAEVTLEELILLHIANFNPAYKKLIELFNQNYFPEKELYEKTIDELDLFFQNEKKLGPDNQDVFTFLKAPIMNNPDNIEAQLDFIREKYGVLLDEKFIKRILTGKDLIKEDYKLEFGGPGGAPTVVPQYKSGMYDDSISLGKSGYKYAADSYKDYEEFENFTPDSNWMPRVVMIAKNVYVWLDQLTKKYQGHIRTLDQIPDEELDQLARWNFNGLWLIGIWERSSASKKIKHIMGNIDAVSSAYSLYDYQIANDLGGELAYNNLNERARARGIRLASDMVPNHTGIFSKWVIEHPEYFIQSNHPPFPNYSFTGNDLSDDHSVQVRIEDGYWRKSDAAVVFQRIDNNSGEVRYIYHGNDGTNMPWNDTAQLNMIRQDVREAVIQKIFEVARKFSIIRFDAAMTLAKKHFSRLWYPEPGRGGDIPSRADYAMTREEFDNVFPVEFWREVVDRINNEMPDTLLLAEAFWLMEGYFVRTLGMHRVYNSAFMHMMMKEENVKYRDLISNTLEFEPEILKRYVNFMSNPDEETAVKQFGTEDKYFGVCMLMITLPGLPMFAHGQIEGYTEKYGMEYQRAYYNETPNQWLIDRHQYEIFPLMKKRYLFSQVSNFWLFDFIDDHGGINENVFAYTNTEYGERVLIFYNNKYENTSGTIFRSSPKLMNNYGGKGLESRTIAEVLWIQSSQKHFYIFRDRISNLEFIKTGIDIAVNGFHAVLGAFKYLVYLDWREVYDENGDWAKLAWKLGNNGVPDMQRAFDEMKVENIHIAFENMFDDESLNGFIKTWFLKDSEGQRKEDKIKFIDKKYKELLESVNNHFNLTKDTKQVLKSFESEILSVCKLNEIMTSKYSANKKIINEEVRKSILKNIYANYSENSILFIFWLVISKMSDLFDVEGGYNKNNYFEKMLLETPVGNILRKIGRSDYEIYRGLILLDILQNGNEIIDEMFGNITTKVEEKTEQKAYLKDHSKYSKLVNLLDQQAVKDFIGVNSYEGILYYSKENFDEFLAWVFTLSILHHFQKDIVAKSNLIKKMNAEDESVIIDKLTSAFEYYVEIKMLSQNSGYQFEKFRKSLADKIYSK